MGARFSTLILAVYVVLFCGAGRSLAKEVTLDPKNETAWVTAVLTIKEGDTVKLDGKEFKVVKNLGQGSQGIAFEVVVEGRTEVLKVSKDPERQRLKPEHTFHAQGKQLETLRRAGVKAPEVYSAPEHSMFIRMQLIKGDTFHVRIVDQLTDPAARHAEMMKAARFAYSLEKAGLAPGDPKWLGQNIVHSDREGVYYFVDPGGLIEKGSPEFPLGLGRLCEPEERAAASLMRLQLLIEDGKAPELKSALEGKGAAFDADFKPNPYWVAELVLRGEHHDPELSFKPKDLIDSTDWSKIKREDVAKLRDRLHARAAELVKENEQRAFFEPDLVEYKLRKRLIALASVPGFEDTKPLEAFLERLSRSEGQSFLRGLPEPLRRRLNETPLVKLWADGKPSDAIDLHAELQKRLVNASLKELQALERLNRKYGFYPEGFAGRRDTAKWDRAMADPEAQLLSPALKNEIHAPTTAAICGAVSKASSP